jgi:hypothetical protein
MPAQWPSQIFRWLGFARYNAAPPSTSDGQVSELQLDPAGRLRVETLCPTPTGTVRGAGVNVLEVKGAPGSLLEVYGFNDAASAVLYLMVFDQLTSPTNGTAPVDVFRLNAASSFDIGFSSPLVCENGIWLAASTTAGTLTLDSSGKLFAKAAYL